MDRDFLFAVASDEYRKGPIPKDQILDAMGTGDSELAGAVYDIVTDDELRKRIDPPLTDSEVEKFLVGYLERCMLTNPEGDWTLTRYDAASEAQSFMLAVWESEGGDSKPFVQWKKWIERLYLAGDDDVKLAIVNGILEHLFEEKGLRRFFADWKEDARFRTAYEYAALWADTQPDNA